MWRTVFLGFLGIFCSISCGRISFDPVAFYDPYAPPPNLDGSTYVDPYAGYNADAGPVSALPVCGNGIKETGESCDGADFGESTCELLSMTGFPVCSENCDVIDYSTCESVELPSPITDGGVFNGDSGVLETGPECGNGILETGEWCDGASFLPSLSCDNMSVAGSTGALGCKADCTVDVSGCIEPPPQCRARTPQDDNLFLVETGLYDFFGSTGSSCMACHVNGPGKSVFTYSTYDVDLFRTTVRENAPNRYRPDSHYQDGNGNYGRVLTGDDVPGLSILAYKSRVGDSSVDNDGNHNQKDEFIEEDGSPNALGQALLTFIDFYIIITGVKVFSQT